MKHVLAQLFEMRGIVRERDEAIRYLQGKLAEQLKLANRVVKKATSVEKQYLKATQQIQHMERSASWRMRSLVCGCNRVTYPIHHPKKVWRLLVSKFKNE